MKKRKWGTWLYLVMLMLGVDIIMIVLKQKKAIDALDKSVFTDYIKVSSIVGWCVTGVAIILTIIAIFMAIKQSANAVAMQKRPAKYSFNSLWIFSVAIMIFAFVRDKYYEFAVYKINRAFDRNQIQDKLCDTDWTTTNYVIMGCIAACVLVVSIVVGCVFQSNYKKKLQ